MNSRISHDEIDGDNIQYYFDLLRLHKWNTFIDKLNSDNIFDVNMVDSYHNYLLTYAILYNQLVIVKLLLQKGARIDITDNEDRSLLYIAIKYNYRDIMEILLESNKEHIGISIIDIRDKNSNVPLHYTISFNNIFAMERLLKYGASPNASDKNGYNSLHLSIFARNIQMCQYVIDYNVDIQSKCLYGESSLHIACNLQLIDIIRLLLLKKININIQDFEHEFTALHYSINLNNKEIVTLLLEHGADPNIQDMVGNTSIHYCINENNLECLILIIKLTSKKINVNLWNFDGYIPLHIALLTNPVNLDEYIELLLEKSNINIQDNDGDTCFHILCKKQIWKNYIKKLETKKIDIFIKNKLNERPIDYIIKTEFELFLNMISESYLNRIRIYEGNIIWNNEWENMCKNELLIHNLSEKEKKVIESIEGKNYKINLFDVSKKKDICKIIIKDQLNDIYNDKNLLMCSKSFPIKQGYACLKMNEGANLNVCTFTGSTIDILIGLIFLLKKYPDACSTISKNFTENKELCKFYKSIGIIMNTHCEFLNFEIIWVYHKLYLIDEFYDNFKKCLNKKDKKYIIIPLGIEMREGSHANYLIFDKQNNEIERFEPHGSSAPTGLNYNPNLLDDILENRFKELVPNAKYIRPSDFLPKIGFQIMDVGERYKRKIGDPGGFCALWAIWYVDMKLTYRTLNRNVLVNQMITSIKSQNISFRNLIRNYAKNIIDIRDNILEKAGIDINDWLNDQFTNSQINIILAELSKEVIALIPV